MFLLGLLPAELDCDVISGRALEDFDIDVSVKFPDIAQTVLYKVLRQTNFVSNEGITEYGAHRNVVQYLSSGPRLY